jgi:hypothetical protein
MNTYPSNWFGGKFRGHLLEKAHCWRIEIKNNSRNIAFSQNIYFNNELEKQVKQEEALRLVREKNEEFGWPVKNKMRYIEKDVIEVALNNDQVMKTDARFIGLIEDHLIYSVKSGGKLGKYYAMVYLGKKDNGKNDQKMFHMHITGNKMTDHINRDTLDNRLCNLRDTTYQENNNNKTFSTYQNENSSGTRGVTFNANQNAWVAKIITNKVNEDGTKRTYTKSFSKAKYGDDEAKQMAIKHREEMCEKFNRDEFLALEDDERKEMYRKRQMEVDEEGNTVKIECKGCEQILPVADFSTKGEGKPSDVCRNCKNSRKKQWLAKRREEKLEQHKEEVSRVAEEKGVGEDQVGGSVNKTCSKCGQEKTLDQFNRHNKSVTGYGNICKDCRTPNRKKTRTRVTDPSGAVTHISCKDCEETLEVTSFTTQGKSKAGETLYLPTCIECIKKRRQSARRQKRCENLDLEEEIFEDSDAETMEALKIDKTEVCRRKDISKTLSEYYQTEEGRLKKQEALRKRSETMKGMKTSPEEKECRSCQQTLPSDSFNKKSAARDGLQPYCKECVGKAKAKSKDKKSTA